MTFNKLVPKILLIAVCLTAFAFVASAAGPVTPDSVTHTFDAWSVTIMLAWGIVQTRVPALKGLINNSVGWVNALGYIMTRLLGGAVAHAAGVGDAGSSSGLLGMIGGALLNAGTAHVIYEFLLRAPLDRMFKKYDPKHPGGWKLAGN